MAAVWFFLLASLSTSVSVLRQNNFEDPTFSAGTAVANVPNPNITAASGFAPSQKFSDVIYTHNDGAGGPYIYAINAKTGKTISTIKIASARNHDWEVIAVGPCGENSCIYIADSGIRRHTSANTIYRVVEPTTLTPYQTLPIDSTAHYTWSEEQSDTLMVDPNGQVYLVSVKESGRGMVSHLHASAWGSSQPANIETAQFLPLQTHHQDPVSGDISKDGNEILIKSKEHIFLWKVVNGDVLSSLMKQPVEVPYYQHEREGSICFSADGQNYYVLHEGINATLYVYTRLHGNGDSGLEGSLVGK